ncbi:MAG: hypothetical protein ABL866_14100 [Devosia sp.]
MSCSQKTTRNQLSPKLTLVAGAPHDAARARDELVELVRTLARRQARRDDARENGARDDASNSHLRPLLV